MHRALLRSNILRYRKLLADNMLANPTTVQRLLAEAEVELQELEIASVHELTRNNAAIAIIAERAVGEAMRLSNAHFGNLQILDAASGSLEILEQRNFRKPFLDHFSKVTPHDGSACGRCLTLDGPVVIEDVESDPAFKCHRQVARQTGFRAVQSTPLRDGSGKLFAVLSTHFSKPRQPSSEERSALDRHSAFVATELARYLSA